MLLLAVWPSSRMVGCARSTLSSGWRNMKHSEAMLMLVAMELIGDGLGHWFWLRILCVLTRLVSTHHRWRQQMWTIRLASATVEETQWITCNPFAMSVIVKRLQKRIKDGNNLLFFWYTQQNIWGFPNRDRSGSLAHACAYHTYRGYGGERVVDGTYT